MLESQALKLMMPPGKRKKHIWRDGIIQIHVTRACDRACFHCTQGSNLRGKPVMITEEQFEEACLSLKNPDYWGVVGMFGGNPAIHPKFESLCEIMRKHFPFEQRGIWCNHPLGKGKIMQRTFNPAHSNLNVHCSDEAWQEFVKDWPESKPYLKGREESRHSPIYISMQEEKDLPHWDRRLKRRMPNTESNRWQLISRCDINQNWSPMVCYVPGRGVRVFFCEIAGAMAMMKGDKWPDVGLPAEQGWWQLPMESFRDQVRESCHNCGVPLNIFGQLEQSGEKEQCSPMFEDICKPKDDRPVELVQIAPLKRVEKMTNYIENGRL